jgi:hypothetical protein
MAASVAGFEEAELQPTTTASTHHTFRTATLRPATMAGQL